MRLSACALMAFSLTVAASAAPADICFSGTAQSPVDLTNAEPARLQPLAVLWGAEAVRAVPHATISGDHRLRLGAAEYRLEAIDIHSPGLHPVEGAVSPLEIVFRHRDGAGHELALSVRARVGAASKATELFLRGGAETLFLRDLLPESRLYYRYEGSEVRSPCAEPVTWIVLADPLDMSGGQIADLAGLAPKSGRPAQPRNNRILLKGVAK